MTWTDEEQGRFEIDSPEETDIDAARHRVIRMELSGEDGGSSRVALLRSVDWIEDAVASGDGKTLDNLSTLIETGFREGEGVGGLACRLDLPEMGLVGEGKVLAIEPCPEIEPGPGRLVTGTFTHEGGEVYHLQHTGEETPLGVTGTHPFWSVDRQDWVPAKELQEGETLQTLTGLATVESFTQRPERETVYNLEVEGDHCYRVGQTGVLVHNASAGRNESRAGNPSEREQPDHVFAKGLGKSLGDWSKLVRCAWPELADAFDGAKLKTQTEPFDLTVTRRIPRPDAHSEAFGRATKSMADALNMFVESAKRDGIEKARIAHTSRLRTSWEALINAVEDKDVSMLVVPGQQRLIARGRQAINEIKTAVLRLL